jgi:hypothetical protein
MDKTVEGTSTSAARRATCRLPMADNDFRMAAKSGTAWRSSAFARRAAVRRRSRA